MSMRLILWLRLCPGLGAEGGAEGRDGGAEGREGGAEGAAKKLEKSSLLDETVCPEN